MMNCAKVFSSPKIRTGVLAAVFIWAVWLCVGAECAAPVSGYLVKDGRAVGCIVLSEKETNPKILTLLRTLPATSGRCPARMCR